MKIILLLITFFFTLSSFSQNIESAKITKVESLIKTIGGNSITIAFTIDLTTGFKIEQSTFDGFNSNVKTKLVSKKLPNLVDQGEKITLSSNPQKISFEIVGASDDLIRFMQEDIAEIYITIDSEITFNIENGTTSKKMKITQLQIEKHSRSSMVLTNLMGEELINARGGDIFVSQNKIDFGVIPSEQASSGKAEYNASFQIRTKYSFIKDLPIFLYTKGLISSNSNDSLNFISIYPVNYDFLKGNSELVGQLGVEGDQTFSSYRISGNFYWNGIMPNLIDLTFGENRLRLKPIINIGLKVYKEIENNRPVELSSNEFSNQLYSQLYYYIPIQKNYSIILDGSAFYDFSSKINPENKFMYNYSFVLGIDIPKTDFKTIFKYTKGNNFVTQESNDYLMIGLLIDMLGNQTFTQKE